MYKKKTVFKAFIQILPPMFFKSKISFSNWWLGPKPKRIKENGFRWFLEAVDIFLWVKFYFLIHNSCEQPVEPPSKKVSLKLCFVRNKGHNFFLCLLTSKLHVTVAGGAKRAQLFIQRARFSKTLILQRKTKLSSQSYQMIPQVTLITAVLWWH